MKNLIVFIILMLSCSILKVSAQSEEEKLDLPGDNLNLYAVLKLFQESETLEGFERNLNEEDSEINNLDLDGDNNTDYIRVEDNLDGNTHTITLKVAVSDREDQDVAVFYVEKKADGEIWIQLVGDEDLYGKDYIIEPNSQSGEPGRAETPNPGYSGNREAQTSAVQQNVTYVSAWPVIRFIFVPQYVVWHSPWRWHYYPSYWRPWRPRFWHYYYGYHYHWHYYYNGHYRRWPSYRNPVWHTRYYEGNFRSRSVIVRTRYTRGDYRKTYSRPSSARQGAALFVKRNPKAPTTRERLPNFDKTGRPVIVRPGNTRPGTTTPVTRPGTTRPSVGRPGSGNTDRPVTRPVNPTPSRPVNPRPARPDVSRPAPPVTRPSVTPPATSRPSPARPAPARPETSRPAPRPTTRQPATPRSSRESAQPRQGAQPRN